MSGLISSITLRFHDQFTQGFQGATNKVNQGYQKINSGVASLQNGSGIMQASRDMAVVSMQMGEFTEKFQSMVAVPGQVSSAFESGMARVSTVLNDQNIIGGDAAATMDTIKAAAQNMAGGVSEAGRIAAVGTDVFTNSVYTMLSSGLSAQAGIAATEQAALLAKATSGEMGDAASALTGIYNNLGDKSANAREEMTRLSDVVAGTQNYFAFENLGQFTEGLKNASGAAVANKIPLTQLSATIGQLNSNMITGAQAGTAVKSIVAQLGPASSKLGFEIGRTAEGGIDLVKTFENIKATGADGQTMMAAFGTEAGPAISLLTENLKDLKSGYDYVNNAQGITMENALKMADTLETKQENLNNAMLVWQGRVGDGANAVKGMGVGMATAGVQLLNWATGLPVVGQGLAGIIGGTIQLTGSLGGVLNAGLQTSTGLLSLIGLVEKSGAIMSVFSGGLTLVSGKLGLMRAGFLKAIPTLGGYMSTMWGVAAAHMAVYWPVYAVIAGVALLAAGVVLLVRHWDTFKVWVSTAWQKIVGWFQQGFGFIKSLFTESPAWVQVALLAFAPWIAIPMQIVAHWDDLKKWFASFADWITGIAGKIAAPFEWAGEKVGGLFDKLGGRKLNATMAEGMTQDQSLYNATSSSFGRVDRLIPHSDAKEGPFSRLTAAGKAITGTMARGVDGKVLSSAVQQDFAGIIPFPGQGEKENTTGRTGLLSIFRNKETKKTGDNHFHINISFDELRDFPSLMEYLMLLKEETDREEAV